MQKQIRPFINAIQKRSFLLHFVQGDEFKVVIIKSTSTFPFSAGHGSQSETQPEFLAPLDNLTVTQGRDVSFTCVVNNLGQYRVSTVEICNGILYI